MLCTTNKIFQIFDVYSSNGSLLRSLSSPLFVPANIPESGKSSGTEESDVDSSSARRSVRRVRFKQLAEVSKGMFIELCTSHPLTSYCMLW